MNCPLLKGRYTKQCAAVKVTLVLSMHELETYCQSDAHKQCPVYQVWRKRSGAEVPLLDYMRVTDQRTKHQSR